MRFENLFAEASKEIDLYSEEDYYTYELGEAFRSWADLLLKRAKSLNEDRHISGFTYAEEDEIKHIADGVVRITKRTVWFTGEAGPEFDDLVGGGGQKVEKATTIGVHDIAFLQPSGEWWQRGRCESCDVITELAIVADPEEEQEDDYYDPFELFQVLERLNWTFPCLEANENAVLQARLRSAKDPGAEIDGMNSSLNDLEDFLASQRY